MKKKLIIFLLCIFVVALLLPGCSKPAPAPAPAPGPSEPGEPAKDPFHVSFTAGRPGDPWYVLSHALATFINDRSDWLTAEVVATAGITDNTRLLMDDPAMRANHVNATMLPGANIWGEGVYFPLQIGMVAMLNDTWVTLDPDIKTLADFSGKTIVLPRDVPDGYTWIFRNWLDLAGVTDYRLMHGGIDARLTALRDGAAEVGLLPFDFYYPNTYTLSASMMELSSRGTLYFPNMGNIAENRRLIAEACETDPFTGDKVLPPLAAVVPANSFGPEQNEDQSFVSTPVYWSAGVEMPEDVVYEITRILWEAAEGGEFIPYHAMGQGLTTEFITMSFWADETERLANFHPGALKFYNEKGVTLKTF